MRLEFPNPSRSFDEHNNRVMFWGYDSAIEVSFFVEVDALKLLVPAMNSVEKEILSAFDSVRDRIQVVADKIYVRGGGGKGVYAYILSADDF